MSVVGSHAQRLLYAVSRAWGRRFRGARRRLGLTHAPRVQGLDGWCTDRDVVVRARVLESRPESALARPQRAHVSRARRLSHRAALLYRRYATIEVPSAEVEVRCEGYCCRVRSDGEGYVVARVPSARPSRSAELSLVAGGAGRGAVQVPLFSPSHRARHLVISDIDDTVLETDLTNPVRRFAQLLLSDRPVRLPFEGVGALYRAFTRAGAPIFYVSNSPIQLHHHLVTMFRVHDLPPGPLLLRDWGLQRRRRTLADFRERHKDRALGQLAEDYPQLPIVLLGDTSRHDSMHYLRLAEARPGRVAAIYIRRVHGPLSRGIDPRALEARAERAGVELVVVDSALELAAHARERGFIADEDVERVRRARRADEARPDPLQGLVES